MFITGFLQTVVLDLRECISRALECDPGLKRQSLEVRRCREDAALNILDWLPSVNVTSGNDFGWGRSVDMQELLIINNGMNFTSSLSAGAALEINELISIIPHYARSRAFISGAEADMERTRSEVIVNVTGAYLGLLLAGQVLETAERNYEDISRRLAEARAKAGAGAVSASSVTGLEAQAADEKAELANAAGKVHLAGMTLKNYLDLAPEENLKILPPAEESFQAPDTDRLLRMADDWDSPEVKAAEAVLAADREHRRSAGLSLLPVLTVSGGYGSYYGNISQGSFREQISGNGSATLGISLTIPILNGSQAVRNYRNAGIKVRQDELEVEKARKAARAAIHNDAVGTAGMYESLMAAGASLDAARTSYGEASLKFSGGSVTDMEFLISRNSLKRAEAVYLQARYRYLMQLKIIEYKYGISLTDRTL